MKKVILTSLFLCLIFLTGCGKYNEKTIVKDLNKKINAISGYHIEGKMEIYNGEDVYKYDVKSSYENDNYRVSLTNTLNNHEQIILRNADGVYVLTPKLNKSFKFQSNWPENNSQVYLLGSILNDINKDDKLKLEEKNGKYILTVKIAYSNNKNLVKQKIYMDKNLNIEKIIVLDENGNKQIKMVFDSIDTNASFNNKYFSVSENMKTVEVEEADNKEKETNEDKTTQDDKDAKTEVNNNENQTKTNKEETTTDTNSYEKSEKNNTKTNADEKNDKQDSKTTTTILEETVYPMYLPSGTYLETEEVVSTDNGDRTILTFSGESPFILVEEAVSKLDEMEIIPVYGEPTILVDTVGALSDTSVNFISNGIEYYIASESLTKQEILEVASSLASIPIMK